MSKQNAGADCVSSIDGFGNKLWKRFGHGIWGELISEYGWFWWEGGGEKGLMCLVLGFVVRLVGTEMKCVDQRFRDEMGCKFVFCKE